MTKGKLHQKGKISPNLINAVSQVHISAPCDLLGDFLLFLSSLFGYHEKTSVRFVFRSHLEDDSSHEAWA